MKISTAKNSEELAGIARAEDPMALSLSEFATHAPDIHIVATDSEGTLARSSVWVRSDGGETFAALGHFAAANSEAARSVLENALTWCRSRHIGRIIGPMNGSTWRSYRFQMDGDGKSAFFLEPENPPEYLSYFSAAGFVEFAQYYSYLNTNLEGTAASRKRIAELQSAGVMLRQFDVQNPDSDLRKIYELSCSEFRANFLYSEIAFEEFAMSYRKVLPYLSPEYVLLAERNGECVAFVFALPDMNEVLGKKRATTLVVKTVAVKQDRAYAGLGTALISEVQNTALSKGFQRAVLALVHEGNRASMNMCKRFGVPFRRYALFEKRLS